MAEVKTTEAVAEVLKKATGRAGYGHGKHDYRAIDPSTINVDDYATSLRGEEEHFGDVREYNSAFNAKHPENDTTLDALGRIGTILETEAPGLEGKWIVSDMPVVRAPITYARLSRIEGENNDVVAGSEQVISCVDLGCAVDPENYFPQVRTKVLVKVRAGKDGRNRLTKK